VSLEPKEAKKLTAVILDLLKKGKTWPWKRWVALLIAVAIAVVIALLHSGCTGLQQKPGAAPAQQTGLGAPAQSASGPAAALGSATQQPASPGSPTGTQGLGLQHQDSTAPAPTASTAGPNSPAASESDVTAPRQTGVGLNNQLTFQVLSGSGGTLALIAILLVLRGPRPPKLRARVARTMSEVLSKAVARLDPDSPEARVVKDKIKEVAEEVGVPEPLIRGARKVLGTD
jgi:hypothetical protein